MPRWFTFGRRKEKKPEENATRDEKPGASSNGSSERQQPGKHDREGDKATKQPELTAHATAELTTSQILWNEAYDSLKVEEAALVKSYVKVMAKNLQPEGTGAVDAVLAKMDDPVERQLAMEKLVRDGVQKIARTSAVANGVGVVADGFLKAKSLVDTAIGNIPQAALPWAGVCVVLQVSWLGQSEVPCSSISPHTCAGPHKSDASLAGEPGRHGVCSSQHGLVLQFVRTHSE
jgi:hypothetical protein